MVGSSCLLLILHYSSDAPVKTKIAKEMEEKEDAFNHKKGFKKTIEQLQNSISKFDEGRSLKLNFNEAFKETTARGAQGKHETCIVDMSHQIS